MTTTEMLDAAPLPCFIRPLRDAIRRGDKTETRRVLKPQPTDNIPREFQQWGLWDNELALVDKRMSDELGPVVDGLESVAEVQEEWTLPQALIGSIYYLREPLAKAKLGKKFYAFYADDEAPVKDRHGMVEWRWQRRVLPQIHMPAAAARTFVRLKRVWTEPLQNITSTAALAEGIARVGYCYQPPGTFYPNTEGGLGPICSTAPLAFRQLWDAINAKRDHGAYAWSKNPIVIVRQFQLETETK